MKRKIKDLVSLNALKHLLYLPIIIYKIKNWYSYLLNYIGFKNNANLYQFRNGIKIKTESNVDTATITVIFIRKDYKDIKNKSIVIDIGANIGVFSVYAASTSRDAKIYAYEPMSDNYNLLIENIKLNKLQNRIIPFQLGVGAKKENRKLFLSKGASPYHSLYFSGKNKTYLEIKTISLKDVFDDNKIEICDLLKSDCEGAEFEIFYNTPDSYLEKINEIRLEYHNSDDDKNNISSLIKFFENKKFSLIYYKQSGSHYGNAWFKRI